MRNNIDVTHAEDAELLARIQDALRISRDKYRACFTGFLDERQRILVESEARRAGNVQVMFYGGHEDAERTVFGAFPDQLEPDKTDFPITVLTASFRSVDTLTHRDFLGSLMSYGIERDTVGDILVEDGRAVLFVLSHIAPYILSQMDKVGRVGVRLEEGAYAPYPAGRGFVVLEGTVVSARLDAVVAALLHISREKSAALIKSGFVQLRFETTENVSAGVQEGDKISVRGYGRYVLLEIGNITRKGRYRFLARKYI